MRGHAGRDGPKVVGAQYGRTCGEGFQALREVHGRWATTDSFSHGRETGMTRLVVLSSTVTSLAGRAGTYSTAYGFFSYTRVWRPAVLSSLSAFPHIVP